MAIKMWTFTWSALIVWTLLEFIFSELINEEYSIRLIDPDGLLEIYHNGQWLKVCDYYQWNRWDSKNSEVVCRQLGYARHDDWRKSFTFEKGVLSSLFTCQQGNERNLSDCERRDNQYMTCTSAVAMKCTNEEKFLRLFDGIYPNVGRLEFFYNGQWNQVCNKSWNEDDSRIACRQLGYEKVDDWARGYVVPNSAGSYVFDFHCNRFSGNDLMDCDRTGYNGYYCSDQVKLQCKNEADFMFSDDLSVKEDHGLISLAGSHLNNEGILLIYLYGKWGSMCADNWSKSDSVTACRQLGYTSVNAKLVSTDDYGDFFKELVDRQVVHSIDFMCSGNEKEMAECQQRIDVNAKCTYKYKVAITCHEDFDDNDGLPVGAIVGIVVLALVVLCAFAACCSWKKRQANSTPSDNASTSVPLNTKQENNDKCASEVETAVNPAEPLKSSSTIVEPDTQEV